MTDILSNTRRHLLACVGIRMLATVPLCTDFSIEVVDSTFADWRRPTTDWPIPT